MLPSLRPLIAESMRVMAYAQNGQSWPQTKRAAAWLAGAETIEWCEANDPDNDPCGQNARVEQLESAFEDLRAALLAWDISTSKKRHEEFQDEIIEILESVTL